MQCPECASHNRPEAKFCSDCGASMAHQCRECGNKLGPDARFCDQCGATARPHAVSPEPAPTTLPVAVPSGNEAEWRQITVLFCDLVSYTELAHRIDPEDLRELVRAYQGVCARVIKSLGGFVARYMGDGMMVYFGYPTAHEDDALRAVRAGLEIIDGMGELNENLGREQDVTLSVRIGIATGRVLVGDLIGEEASEERAVLGETPNLAARLEGVAAPNTVVVAPSTLELLGAIAVHENLGSAQLKGFAEPVALIRVVRLLKGVSRFEATHGERHLTPLVGRDDELRVLQRRWQGAREGEGHVVLLSGEPGIGKSRLVQTLFDQARDETAYCWRLQCSSQHTNSALYPVIVQLEHAARFEPGDDAATKLAKLTRTLGEAGSGTQQTVSLLAPLLSVPIENASDARDASPQRQKDETLQALLSVLRDFAEVRPVLVVFEDVHWIDPTTQELLDLIIDAVAQLPILVLVTFRPSYVPTWVGDSRVTLLALSRLSERERAEMVNRLLRDKSLPQALLTQIVDKTDGIPLFVEELTMLVAAMEAGDGTSSRWEAGLKIPSTLRDSLTARLDQLGDAKELAQIGAAIGREFDYDLLRSVAPWDDSVLHDKLSRLVELLHGRGVGPRMRYAFKHALVQEAAYSSLLKRTRRQYHERIAESLESEFAEICETQPELLAHHYAQAGHSERAADWWLRAGRRALSRCANAEAIHHLECGLVAVRELTDSEARRRMELDFHTTLGPALFATQGYAAPEVERVYRRGRELCALVGESPELFSVHWGLWAFHVVRADLELALETGQEMLRLAQEDNDRSWRIEALLAVGLTRYFQGHPQEALAALEQAIGLDHPGRDRSFTRRSGQDAVVCSLSYAGLCLWLLGRYDEAAARGREATALARALEHPFSLAYALNFGGWLTFMLRDTQDTLRLTDEEIKISEKLGFFWQDLGAAARGWALAQDGQVETGLAELRRGVAAYRATGARLSETLLLAMEADTCLLAGQFEAGLERIEEGLSAATATGESVWLGELHRLQGNLRRARGDHGAEQALREALAIAAKHKAPGAGLRAAADLARLLHVEGRSVEALEILRPLRASVVGDSRLLDLQECDALIAEIEGSASVTKGPRAA